MRCIGDTGDKYKQRQIPKIEYRLINIRLRGRDDETTGKYNEKTCNNK